MSIWNLVVAFLSSDEIKPLYATECIQVKPFTAKSNLVYQRFIPHYKFKSKWFSLSNWYDSDWLNLETVTVYNFGMQKHMKILKILRRTHIHIDDIGLVFCWDWAVLGAVTLICHSNRFFLSNWAGFFPKCILKASFFCLLLKIMICFVCESLIILEKKQWKFVIFLKPKIEIHHTS